MLTKVFIEKYKGNPIMAVWEVDGAGHKVGRYPIISFGKNKAKLILENIKDVESFVNSVDIKAVELTPVEDEELPF